MARLAGLRTLIINLGVVLLSNLALALRSGPHPLGPFLIERRRVTRS
jgi:hypothetical protein